MFTKKRNLILMLITLVAMVFALSHVTSRYLTHDKCKDVPFYKVYLRDGSEWDIYKIEGPDEDNIDMYLQDGTEIVFEFHNVIVALRPRESYWYKNECE